MAIYAESDGAGGLNIYVPMPGSVDGLDHAKWNMKDFPLYNGCEGMADGGAWHVRGDGNGFGSNIHQLIHTAGAMFDSTKQVGVSSGNMFWAHVTAGGHGNLREVAHWTQKDGAQYMPGSLVSASEIRLRQVCEVKSFITGEIVALRYALFVFDDCGLHYSPSWELLQDFEVASASYPAMMGTKVSDSTGLESLFTTVRTMEGVSTISRMDGSPTTDPVTAYPWVQLEGGGYFARLAVDTGASVKEGFLSGTSHMKVDNANTTNNGKTYFRPSPSATVSGVAGEVWKHGAHYTLGLL